MTTTQIIQKSLRPVGLVLYAIGHAVGYLWGHFTGGLYDGAFDAHKETE